MTTREQMVKDRNKQWAREEFVKALTPTLLREIAIEALDVDKLVDMTDAELLRMPYVGIASMTKLRTLLELYREKRGSWE